MSIRPLPIRPPRGVILPETSCFGARRDSADGPRPQIRGQGPLSHPIGFQTPSGSGMLSTGGACSALLRLGQRLAQHLQKSLGGFGEHLISFPHHAHGRFRERHDGPEAQRAVSRDVEDLVQAQHIA